MSRKRHIMLIPSQDFFIFHDCPKNPECPKCKSKFTIKRGLFHRKYDVKQRWFCTICNTKFSGKIIPNLETKWKPRIYKPITKKVKPIKKVIPKIKEKNPRCIFCASKKVSKHGSYNNEQNFQCQNCKKYFYKREIKPNIPFIKIGALFKISSTVDSMDNVPCFGCLVRACDPKHCDILDQKLMEEVENNGA